MSKTVRQQKNITTVTTNDDSSQMVNSVEAARRIGIPYQTLRIWRHEQREGQPPFTKHPNGRVTYLMSDLEAYLAANRRQY